MYQIFFILFRYLSRQLYLYLLSFIFLCFILSVCFFLLLFFLILFFFYFFIPLESRLGFAYRGITLYADAFQRLPLPKRFVTLCQISSSD